MDPAAEGAGSQVLGTDAAYLRGRFYLRLGRNHEARRCLWASIRARPLHASGWLKMLASFFPPRITQLLTGLDYEESHRLWEEALRLPGYDTLYQSMICEAADFLQEAPEAIDIRARQGVVLMANEWRKRNPRSPDEISRFYSAPIGYIETLTAVHAAPFTFGGYYFVRVLKQAQRMRARSYLDFGSGIGSSGILFAKHGFQVCMADVGDPLLAYARHRLRKRDLTAQVVDLKRESLPREQFDVATALDVFEHLADPFAALDDLREALRHKGVLFANFPFGPTESHPMHLPHSIPDFLEHARRRKMKLVRSGIKHVFAFRKE